MKSVFLVISYKYLMYLSQSDGAPTLLNALKNSFLLVADMALTLLHVRIAISVGVNPALIRMQSLKS